ncbi:MAG: DUF4239 domain-containing protein [Steroidobacteraceae bacterium]
MSRTNWLAAGALCAAVPAAAADVDGTELIKAAPVLCAILFVGILVLLETGRRFATSRLRSDPEGARAGVGTVEGAVFGLLALLIAFTFSGAAERFNARRALIVEETNDIGTAWLRLDLLPPEEQPALRELFRRYTDSRIETYRKLPDVEAHEAESARSARLQAQIWEHAIRAIRNADSAPTTTLLLPALNAMFDIASTRAMAGRTHPPLIIFIMLVAVVLAGATFVGYGMAGGRSRSWLHVLGFAIVMTLTVYVIIDLEYPRVGLIRVDAADQMMTVLRETMR